MELFSKEAKQNQNKCKLFTKSYWLLPMTSLKLGFLNSFPFSTNLLKELNDLTTFLKNSFESYSIELINSSNTSAITTGALQEGSVV